MAGDDVIEVDFGGGAHDGAGGPGLEDLARYPLNDIGNAMRLILMAGGAIRRSGEVDSKHSRLLHLLGYGWIGFNGKFWDRKFGEELARKLAHQVANKMPSLYPFYCPEDKATAAMTKEFFRFCNDAGSAGKTSAMLRQAQSYLMVEIDAFDRDPLALTCLNGTVKMRWTPPTATAEGRFTVRIHDHSAADRITRCCSVDYDPDATSPLFRMVVDVAVPVPDERVYLQRVLAYGSTGYTHEQVFFMFQGRGRDGKSTILDACRETLGSYGVAASPETFLEGGIRGGGDASPDLIALSGDTRFAVLSEPKRGSKMNEGLLKAWTSGSPISARDLHAKPINFRPKAKLFWEMNAFVVARGDDDGIWRRIRPLLFRHQVPKPEVDKLLPEKLRPEFPGILNWLIEGVGDWLAAGALDPPASLESVLEDYRRASSPFGDWLAEYCVTGDAAAGCRELSKDLYTSFKAWSDDQGHEKVMSTRAFGDALRDRQVLLAGKNGAGNKMRGPVRLKSEAERLAEAAEAAPDDLPPTDPSSASRATKGAPGVGDQRGQEPPEPGAYDGDDEPPEDWGGQ